MYPDAESPDACLKSRANRVSRACDRCRIRKIKCNGKSQCNRCTVDDAICVYSKKRRPNDRAYSKEYVQLLEEQRTALVKGVKELCRRHSVGQQLPDLPSGSGENMLIHEVLNALDVLPEKKDPFDPDGIVGVDEFPISSSSSVCESSYPQRSLSESSAPNLSMSSTCSSDANSPTMSSYVDFEVLMNSLDDGQLQMMQILTEPRMKANEDNFAQAFRQAYLVNNSTHDFVMSLPGDPFVNPRDTSYSIPFHMGQGFGT